MLGAKDAGATAGTAMPLYEYRCNKCSKRFTFLVGMVADNTEPKCPDCGSVDLTKLISRVQRLRGDEETLERMAESVDQMDLEDPRAVRQFGQRVAREMASETGEDMGEEFEAMMEEEMAKEGKNKDNTSAADDTVY